MRAGLLAIALFALVGANGCSASGEPEPASGDDAAPVMAAASDMAGTDTDGAIDGTSQADAAPATDDREYVGRSPLSSAYTRLDLDACKVTQRMTEGESISWRCPGYKGVPLHVHSGDGRFDINAGKTESDGSFTTLAAFNDPPETIEWRLVNGTPTAIIYRLHDVAPESPKRSVLFVKAVPTEDHPGCLLARIEGSTPKANEMARRYANETFENAVCQGKPPAEIGYVR